MVALEQFIPQKSWKDAPKKRMANSGEVASSLLTPPRQASESGFEILVKSRETQKFFPIVIWTCCDISKTNYMFSRRHDAGG